MDGQEELQVRQRAKPQRRQNVVETAEEERPENVEGHTTRGADQLSAVQQNIQDVSNALFRKVDRNYHQYKKKLVEKHMVNPTMKFPIRSKRNLKRIQMYVLLNYYLIQSHLHKPWKMYSIILSWSRKAKHHYV